MLFSLSFIIFCVVCSGDAKHEDYSQYRVYKIKLTTEEQKNNLDKLKNDLTDYWTYPSFDNEFEGRVMIPPAEFNKFEETLKQLGVERNVEIEDVHEYLNIKDKQLTKTLAYESRQFGFEKYHRYNEILEHLNTIVDNFNNTEINVDLIEYGKTTEGRPLVYLQINHDAEKNKPVAIIEAGINPREWITIPAAINVAENVINNQTLSNFEWIVIPVLNPDGYEYTHTNLRLWTKSMSVNSNLGFICPGVNLDRNFDIDWMVSDSSSSPCSHLYSGIEPFSEVETKFIKSILDKYNGRVKLYVSLQNKNGFITYPWQFEQAASGMFRQHYHIGVEMARASKYDYKVDVAAVAIGERISGTSTDYARQHKALYTYNMEVVGRGEDFVFIPEDEINDVVQDVWEVISTAAIKINLE